MMGGMMERNREADTPEPEGREDQASIFLSPAELGGRKVKKGDSLVFTVADVDPETGTVQADLASGGGAPQPEAASYEEDFDNAMPEETEV